MVGNFELASASALGIGAASFARGSWRRRRKRNLESDAEFGSETVSKRKKI